jgi:hypothetical protein
MVAARAEVAIVTERETAKSAARERWKFMATSQWED